MRDSCFARTDLHRGRSMCPDLRESATPLLISLGRHGNFSSVRFSHSRSCIPDRREPFDSSPQAGFSTEPGFLKQFAVHTVHE